MDKKNVIATLTKNGAKMIKGLTIRNATVTPQDESFRFGLTLNQNIEAYVADEDGNYNLGENNIIFTYIFSIAAILRDYPDVAFIINELIKKPDAMRMILIGATVDIMQEHVAAGTEYHNPWSNTQNAKTYDHDVIINHIIDIELSDYMKKKIDKMADSILGIN